MRDSSEGLEVLRTYVDALKLVAEVIVKAAELEEAHGKSLIEIAKIL